VRAAGKALAYSSRISAINADVERMDVVAETLCPALKKPIAHPGGLRQAHRHGTR
jgi:hypothetical protein